MQGILNRKTDSIKLYDQITNIPYMYYFPQFQRTKLKLMKQNTNYYRRKIDEILILHNSADYAIQYLKV